MMTSRRPRLHPLLSWMSTVLALLAGDRLLDGVFLSGLVPALVAATVLGLVNIFIRPILFVLTFPINLLTLGLFTFVLNAMMLGLASWLVPGFRIESMLSAIGFAIVVAVIHALATAMLGERYRDYE
ncbi:MAG: phage holin family protein [Hyphomonadaceae bacterium]